MLAKSADREGAGGGGGEEKKRENKSVAYFYVEQIMNTNYWFGRHELGG